ncbi:MAG: AAA family ATPase [Micromonosporaceae bacterium]
MRPLRLDLAGFTVFREETTVDFTGADFFALVGPTGSGKSTVLDAICFALYGTVPRWDNVRSVVNALAPSCPEARVRLIFESSGHRYAASRVVRRVGRGGDRVQQAHAGLERLPDGFDLTELDTGITELGEVLAGTPGEMDAAVTAAIGLPYEQFVTCVVLPQGQFAQFLHAKGAQRQQILVNLLGLHVYERVRERAVAQQREAEQRVATIGELVGDLSDVDDATLDAATRRVSVLRRLAGEVDAVLPELEAARTRVAEARQALQRWDGEITQLTAVRPPADAASLASAAERARQRATEASDAVVEAEDAENALRHRLDELPDAATLRRALDNHTARDRFTGEAARFAETIEVAETELRAAHETVDAAEETLTSAEAELADAQTAHLAAGVRTHLVSGEPCPVCRQPVASIPDEPAPVALAEAKAGVATARQHRTKADSDARDLERSLAQARAHHERLRSQLADLDATLAGSADPEALSDQLAAVESLTQQVMTAGAAVRTARQRQRQARAAEEQTQSAVREAWRTFDRARDGLAPLGPPPTDRDDLAAAWRRLSGWTATEAKRRTGERATRADAVTAAESAVRQLHDRLDRMFSVAELTPPGQQAGHARAAAVATERAEGELRRLTERREQAATLRDQQAAQERQAQVARALANHLKATNFERWLLEEALDLLVDGASETLRELSGGQYDLVHEKGEFAVVDHHDADLRRAVRTLSGGETFQASLALALALSEQLTGMSTSATSLESIVLDEGFGTLDAGTLDVVAATLERLAARGDRMVGVVTHVPALAERIPVRYEVSKDARTARVERVSG